MKIEAVCHLLYLWNWESLLIHQDTAACFYHVPAKQDLSLPPGDNHSSGRGTGADCGGPSGTWGGAPPLARKRLEVASELLFELSVPSTVGNHEERQTLLKTKSNCALKKDTKRNLKILIRVFPSPSTKTCNVVGTLRALERRDPKTEGWEAWTLTRGSPSAALNVDSSFYQMTRL